MVTIRPADTSDAPELVRLINANLEHLKNFAFFQEPVTLEKEEEYLEGDSNSGDSELFVIESDGAIVGTIGLHEMDFSNKVARIGATIFDPKHRHQHIGTTAINLMREYGFIDLSFNKIFLKVFVENDPYRSLYESLGFKFDHIERSAYLLNGVFHDMAVMSMVKSEWEEMFL